MTEVRREFVRDIRPWRSIRPVLFTDDLAVEIYTDLLFVRHLAAGGP